MLSPPRSDATKIAVSCLNPSNVKHTFDSPMILRPWPVRLTMPILGGKMFKLACRATLLQTTDCVAIITEELAKNYDPAGHGPRLPVHFLFPKMTLDTSEAVVGIQ